MKINDKYAFVSKDSVGELHHLGAYQLRISETCLTFSQFFGLRSVSMQNVGGEWRAVSVTPVELRAVVLWWDNV